MKNTNEQTTGYGAWLMRQPEFTEAGPLVRAITEDLATRRLARVPGTVREFERWLRSRPACPPEQVVALRSTVTQWQYWLRSLAEDERPDIGAFAKPPIDNPFARGVAGIIHLDPFNN